METNKFELVGRVNHIDYKVYENGNSTARILLSKKVGEDKYNSFNVTMFGKDAEDFADTVKKGDYAYLTGRLYPNEYKDKEGKDRKDLQLIANSFVKVAYDTNAKSYVPIVGTTPATTPASSVQGTFPWEQ